MSYALGQGDEVRDDEVSRRRPSASSSSLVPKRNLLHVGVSMLIAGLISASMGSAVHSLSSAPNDVDTLNDTGRPVVTIAQGQLRGYNTESGPYLFNNIPFAQPPVGKLRWQPPQMPPPSWTGVRDAQALPNACVQANILIPNTPINGNATGSEDCLYLNVYTKRITLDNNGTTSIINPDKPLSPVLVFVHGGSSVSGWSALDLYDHQKLVANRDVVAVTVNYRLNVFGYLALDVLTSNEYNLTGRRTSGNYGLLDNIAALKWVKGNIAAFGGDQNHVTIYGQSTGGTNVVCLFMSPLARGLFNAVLSLSASPVLKGDLAFASKQNEPFLSLSGCDNETASEAEILDCIYALSPQAALSAMPPRWLNSDDAGLFNFSYPDAALIIVDEFVVPAEINTALSHGAGAEVVIEYGHMAQEIDYGPLQQPINLTQAQFAQFLTALTPTLGWNATQTEYVIEVYPISDYNNDSLLTYFSFVNDCIACGGVVNLNETSNSHPRHTSPIFHHIIHYRPSVPTEYLGDTGWPIAYAGHMWDLLLFLETYPDTYPVTPLDQQHTEQLRKFWIDQLTTKLTITDTASWPEFNQAQLSGKANSSWTLEFLESDQPGFVATPNYHGDKCALLREYGFGSAGWAN